MHKEMLDFRKMALVGVLQGTAYRLIRYRPARTFATGVSILFSEGILCFSGLAHRLFVVG